MTAMKKVEQARARDQVRKHRERGKAAEQQTLTKALSLAQAVGKALS